MIQGLNHITLVVRELDLAFTFYHDVLRLRPLARWARGAYLLAEDNTWLCLEQTDEGAQPSRGHIAFTVSEESFGQTRDRIVSSGAPSWKDNSSEGDSWYFADPSGNRLEIHVGSWQTRLASRRARPYDGMVFFEQPPPASSAILDK
ncbi:MAG: VOC family protein [Myxococcota bacterium]